VQLVRMAGVVSDVFLSFFCCCCYTPGGHHYNGSHPIPGRAGRSRGKPLSLQVRVLIEYIDLLQFEHT
jgi:hypothetical protein